MQTLIDLLHSKTKLKKEHIQNILKLLDEGSTIPFIARYRKEMTGGADDEVLRDFESVYLSSKKLLERKDEVMRLIDERATLTPTLKEHIQKADSLRVLEEIYRPYKEKRNTRATTAIANGLTPLANTLQHANLSIQAFKTEAKRYVKKDVRSVEAAIKGAQDILAERYAENTREREAIRNNMLNHGRLETKKTKTFKSDGVYKNLVGKNERVSYLPSYRYLAIMRANKEKELSQKITIDTDRIHSNIKQYNIPKNAASSASLLFDAYADGLKRLLLPSIEREVHSELKERADRDAIKVFGKNLGQLLMSRPVTKRVLLGVDPAYVSGCKLAVINENGDYLQSAVIYPTPPRSDYNASKSKVLALIKKFHVDAAAIGNGTGSRETQAFFAQLNKEEKLGFDYTVVSEAGASVYSASKLAQEEYPDLDVTIRGAISIAQRLRDPLATFVKIDPKSLGIGQYQHDVDQKLLKKRLDDVTSDVVNRVGVDINSASATLLSHVAGISKKIATNIVDYKKEHGDFTTKSQLLKVKGLGQKAYEQAVGFIRIKEGKNVFDNSGIHPESYEVAKKIMHLDLNELDLDSKAKELHIGTQTLQDIILELQKPGFDPRETLPAIPFKQDLTEISMLQEGDLISGIVRNITDFGAFVDIGLKNDGMIHISKMGPTRVAHPLEVLSINQYLSQVEVISVDYEKGKVGLSLLNAS